jgi:abequosyltransferase
MPTNRPLLTIAIPTYNRSKFLEELLAVLKPQMAEDFRVELLISDNASTDDTQLLLGELAKSGLIFRYIKNKKNLGADKNILQCFEEAQGKYVWIFGDDDIILPGALKKIMRLLSLHEYDLVYLRPYEFLKDYKAEHRHNSADRKALIIGDPKLFTEMVGVMFAFISGVIVNKQRFNEVPHRPCEKFSDTHLIQLAWIFPLLSSYRKGLFVFEALVAARGGNTGGYGAGEVFGRNLKQLSDELLSKDSQLGEVIINSLLCHWFPHFLLQLRKFNAGKFNEENLDQILRPLFSNNFRYWFFVFPLIKTPLWFVEIWRYIGKNVNRIQLLRLKAYRGVYLRNDYLRTFSL